MIEIALTAADVDAFATTSHDRSPLHLSDEYARTTPFGSRVVFGSLAVIAGLGALPPQPGRRLARLVVEFRRPLFPDVPYAAEAVAKSDGRWTIRVLDGTQVLLRVTATFTDGDAAGVPSCPSVALRTTAVDRAGPQIAPADAVAFDYAPAAAGVAALARRHRLAERGVGGFHVAVLAACSYLVGMEMPGERALFSGVDLDFDDGASAAHAPMRCTAIVESNDDRFDAISMRVEFVAGAASARGQVRAFVRRPPVEIDPARLTGLPAADAFAGKVAAVIGASRGLGAALSLALVRCGCAVTATYAKSRRQADVLLAHAADASGRLEFFQADASDADAATALRDDLLHRHGRIDLLVLCAAPPLLPMELSPATARRVDEFVATSVAMAEVPLTAFLPALSTSAGRVIVFSSAAVRNPPVGWPHYVAAKRAIEELVRRVAAAHPRVSVTLLRPPRVLTDLTNTVTGREGALFPEHVASAIVRDLIASPPGGVRLVEEFDG